MDIRRADDFLIRPKLLRQSDLLQLAARRDAPVSLSICYGIILDRILGLAPVRVTERLSQYTERLSQHTERLSQPTTQCKMIYLREGYQSCRDEIEI